MNAKHLPEMRRGITRLEVLVGIAFLLVLVNMFFPPGYPFSERGNITKGISNCRQIAMALNLYAADHDGKYPDATLVNPKSSNEVFRILFKEGIIDSESIFGCPLSPFEPDGDIGVTEDGSKALEAGENHWAMTRGLKEDSPGNVPLVYENPVKATWPPLWNPNAKGTPKRGRSWSTGIIVGLNDGSVQNLPLASKKGTAAPLKKLPAEGSKPEMDLFERAINPKDFPVGKMLDVE